MNSMRFDPITVSALLPLGHLRASINLGNPILANRDPASGQPVGVSVDLARALAEALEVELKLVVVDSAGKSVENVAAGIADIGFCALDPLRAETLSFTPPYVVIEGAYLVRNESPIVNLAQVDQAGVRVVVGKGSAYDLHLTRSFQRATITRAPTSPTVVDTFLSGAQDVAAGVRQQLEADALRSPGLRLLPGSFMQIAQAVATARSRGDAVTALLSQYVEQQKACGFVSQSLARHQISGTRVAEPHIK